jgi:hypothetical protein
MKFLYHVFRFLTVFCISIASVILLIVALFFSVKFFVPDFSIDSKLGMLPFRVGGILLAIYLYGYIDRWIFEPKK